MWWGWVGGGHNPHITNIQGQTKNLYDIKKILSKVRTKKAIWLRFLVNAAILINKNYTTEHKHSDIKLKLSSALFRRHVGQTLVIESRH